MSLRFQFLLKFFPSSIVKTFIQHNTLSYFFPLTAMSDSDSDINPARRICPVLLSQRYCPGQGSTCKFNHVVVTSQPKGRSTDHRVDPRSANAVPIGRVNSNREYDDDHPQAFNEAPSRHYPNNASQGHDDRQPPSPVPEYRHSAPRAPTRVMDIPPIHEPARGHYVDTVKQGEFAATESNAAPVRGIHPGLQAVLQRKMQHTSVHDSHREAPSHVAHREAPSHVAHREAPAPSQVAHREAPAPSQVMQREAPAASHVSHREAPAASHVSHREAPAPLKARSDIESIRAGYGQLEWLNCIVLNRFKKDPPNGQVGGYDYIKQVVKLAGGVYTQQGSLILHTVRDLEQELDHLVGSLLKNARSRAQQCLEKIQQVNQWALFKSLMFINAYSNGPQRGEVFHYLPEDFCTTEPEWADYLNAFCDPLLDTPVYDTAPVTYNPRFPCYVSIHDGELVKTLDRHQLDRTEKIFRVISVSYKNSEVGEVSAFSSSYFSVRCFLPGRCRVRL